MTDTQLSDAPSDAGTTAPVAREADAEAVATAFYAALERSWNAADGAGFGAEFTDGTVFVDIRGVDHHGGAKEIAESHQWIFDTIYKGSVIRYQLQEAAPVGGVIIAHGRATLDAPGGPLAGIHHAFSTAVLIPVGDGWKGVRFHNTLVMEQPAAPAT